MGKPILENFYIVVVRVCGCDGTVLDKGYINLHKGTILIFDKARFNHI